MAIWDLAASSKRLELLPAEVKMAQDMIARLVLKGSTAVTNSCGRVLRMCDTVWFLANNVQSSIPELKNYLPNPSCTTHIR
eukprot:892611-Amphidinium_carterae.1